MKFKIINSSIFRTKEQNVVFLRKLSWDDWFIFSTLYFLTYADSDGIIHEIGSTKIGEVGLEGARVNLGDSKKRTPNLPSEFEQLDKEFFSLGQDASFYQNLNKLGGNIRGEVLEAINDIAFSEEIYNYAIKEEVTKISLLRDVSIISVKGQYRRLAIGNSKLSSYTFTYTSKKYGSNEPYRISFEVKPHSNPPTNVQVIIGRNGVGKTSLLNGMINSLLEEDSPRKKIEYGFFEIQTSDDEENNFANLISVSFSAFDDNEPLNERKDKSNGLNSSYIGLKRPLKKDGSIANPKSTWMLQTEFFNSLLACIQMNKLDLWKRSIHVLESDRIFKDSGVIGLPNYYDSDEKEFELNARKFFDRFSSGHRIVLLTITKLVEKIEERSLVLLDEPEAHLHPPLLAAFIRVLSDLMVIRNGVAIVATHSPVVLQEVPKSCVWKLSRDGAIAKAERLEYETFAENVGTLTKEIFGLEITESGYHKLISQKVDEYESLDEVVESFNNEIGQEGLAIARTLIHLKNNNAKN